MWCSHLEMFDPFRQDPRFISLMSRMGLCEENRASDCDPMPPSARRSRRGRARRATTMTIRSHLRAPFHSDLFARDHFTESTGFPSTSRQEALSEYDEPS